MKNTMRIQMVAITAVILFLWVYLSVIKTEMIALPNSVIAMLLISVLGKSTEKALQIWSEVTGKKLVVPTAPAPQQ
jgi:hypothetical protein